MFSGRWLFITSWEFGASIFNLEVTSTLKMDVICFSGEFPPSRIHGTKSEGHNFSRIESLEIYSNNCS